ncbi:MAG: response regulator [Chloroflexi bacterium]|nr:response regulator [Chloroflexota bacterium]
MAHVLVVDDDRDIQSVLREALEQAGHQVSGATNGLDALDAVRADPPDAVLLDVAMPGLDGLEFVDAWRSVDPRARTPVIVISAAPDLSPSFADLGVREHVTKPFDPYLVVDLLGRQLAS